MKLPLGLRTFKDRIEDISNEIIKGNGFWIYLKENWIDSEGTSQIIHCDTIKECIPHLQQAKKKV